MIPSKLFSLSIALISLALPLVHVDSFLQTQRHGYHIKHHRQAVPARELKPVSTRTASESDNEESNSTSYPNLSIIGICGGIGTGKSYTSSLLVSKLNSILMSGDNGTTTTTTSTVTTNTNVDQIAFHIDADKLGHGVYAPGSAALEEIGLAFGEGVIFNNGTVNRKALGSIVFNDENQMAKLEQIVWPHIKNLLLKHLDEIESSPSIVTKQKIVVVEAAVLLDLWGDNQLFDAVWVVQSSLQIQQLEKRGLNKEDALERMEAQLTRRGIGNLEQELEIGSITAVIENNGDELWETLQQCLTNPKSWKNGRCPNDILESVTRTRG